MKKALLTKTDSIVGAIARQHLDHNLQLLRSGLHYTSLRNCWEFHIYELVQTPKNNGILPIIPDDKKYNNRSYSYSTGNANKFWYEKVHQRVHEMLKQDRFKTIADDILDQGDGSQQREES